MGGAIGLPEVAGAAAGSNGTRALGNRASEGAVCRGKRTQPLGEEGSVGGAAEKRARGMSVQLPRVFCETGGEEVGREWAESDREWTDSGQTVDGQWTDSGLTSGREGMKRLTEVLECGVGVWELGVGVSEGGVGVLECGVGVYWRNWWA